MGTDTPVEGGEPKPGIKAESKPFHHGSRNANRRDNFTKKEKFVGADPKLRGQVFEAKRNRSEQVSNFNTVDELIKAQVGTECDPFVLESLEKEIETLPSEPVPVMDSAGVISELEKLKFKSKYDKHLSRLDKVEMQLKQTYSKYYGQIDEDMNATLKEDPDYERAHKKKDVVKLRKLLKNINFNYKKSEEPIKTLCQANKDLTNMRQYKMDLTEYDQKFKSLTKVVEELQQSDNDSPFVDIICRERKIDPTTLTSMI